jgi:soluble lytic murein transglycosylase
MASGCSLGQRPPPAAVTPVPAIAGSASVPLLGGGSGTTVPDDPVLWDWAAYESIAALARRGDVDEARDAAARLATSFPDSIWIGRARLEVGLAMRRAGDDAGAAAWLGDAAAELDGDRPYWARAKLGQAESTARLGDHAAAFEQARSIRTRLPGTMAARRARRLARRLARQDPSVLATPEARLAEAELRLGESDPAGAKDLVRDLDAAGSPDRDEARWIAARAWQALGDSAHATGLCRALATDGAPAVGATALYAAGRWRWNADDDDEAARIFDEVRERFPGSDEAAAASYALGRIDQTAGRYDAAAAAYDRVRSSRLAADAGWGAAWAEYLAGHWQDAAARFHALGSLVEAEGDEAPVYWEARALANAGDPRGMATLQRLAERRDDGYYGYMAARYLTGARLDPSTAAVLAPPPPPFPDELTGPHADRARAYLALGRRDLARRELDAVAAAGPSRLLLRAYEAVGAPGRTLQLTRRSLRVDERRERRLFPLGYWNEVAPAASRRGIDPLLILAVIRQESGFDQDAVSPAGAYGLMQLVPSTAADVAAELGMPPPDRWALHRVPLNVALGTTLVSKLLRDYDGSEIRALAAYNAGEPAVAKWDTRSRSRPDDEFVELISYAETRRYVKKVLGNYLRYRQLYAPTASAMSLGSPPNAPFDMMTITSPGWADAAR